MVTRHENPRYRSRLVVREVKKSQNQRVLSDAQLFAAMPPLEQLKLQCSILVSKKRSKRGGKLKMRFYTD